MIFIKPENYRIPGFVGTLSFPSAKLLSDVIRVETPAKRFSAEQVMHEISINFYHLISPEKALIDNLKKLPGGVPHPPGLLLMSCA